MKPAFAVSIFTVCLLCLISSSSVQAYPVVPLMNDDSVKAQIIKDWQRAKAYTQEYLSAMPEDGMGFKPTPEIRSFAEQMLHLSNANINLVSTGTGKKKIYEGKNLEKMDEYKNRDALTKVVMESYDFAIDAIKGTDAGKLGEQVKSGNYDLSRLTWIGKAFEHQSHHRGQCTIYLRMKGVTPPNEKLF